MTNGLLGSLLNLFNPMTYIAPLFGHNPFQTPAPSPTTPPTTTKNMGNFFGSLMYLLNPNPNNKPFMGFGNLLRPWLYWPIHLHHHGHMHNGHPDHQTHDGHHFHLTQNRKSTPLATTQTTITTTTRSTTATTTAGIQTFTTAIKTASTTPLTSTMPTAKRTTQFPPGFNWLTIPRK